MERNDLIWETKGLHDRPRCVISPDSKILIGSIKGSKRLNLWNLMSGRIEAMFGSGTLKGISPKGNYIVTSSREHSRSIPGRYYKNFKIEVWDFKIRKKIFSFTEHTRSVRGIFFSHNESLLYSLSNKFCKVWNIPSGNLNYKINFDGTNNLIQNDSIIISPKWNYIASRSENGSIQILKNLINNDLITISPKLKYIASSEKGPIELWDFSNPSNLIAVLKEDNCKSKFLIFSNDEKYLYSWNDCRGDYHINIWNLESKQIVKKIKPAYSINLTPDKRFLIYAGGKTTLIIQDLNSNTIYKYKGMGSQINEDTLLSPDGNILIGIGGSSISGIPGFIKVWDFSKIRKMQEERDRENQIKNEKLRIEQEKLVKQVKRELDDKILYIKKLIQETQFSKATRELEYTKDKAKKYSLIEIYSWAKKNFEFCNSYIIKKNILDLGTKFARLQISEISEVCNIKDEQFIVKIVKEMIENKEIHAHYFSSSKAVAFNQQANMEEIDSLMATYKEWEEKGVEKK